MKMNFIAFRRINVFYIEAAATGKQTNSLLEGCRRQAKKFECLISIAEFALRNIIFTTK